MGREGQRCGAERLAKENAAHGGGVKGGNAEGEVQGAERFNSRLCSFRKCLFAFVKNDYATRLCSSPNQKNSLSMGKTIKEVHFFEKIIEFLCCL